MSLAFSDVITQVRYVINDVAATIRQFETYDSSGTRPTVFTLDESNPISVSAVYKNGTSQDSSTWAYDSTTGEVTCSFSLSNGDTLEFVYTAYENYSDTEITSYIYSALYWISVCGYKTYKVVSEAIYPDPTDAEENLLAIVVGILIAPNNQSYVLPNLRVNVTETRPTEKIIKDIINQFKRCPEGIISII